MKKAQVFVQDMIIALVLMSIMLFLFFSFYTNQNMKGENIEQSLISEAKTISDYLTSPGYPLNWNVSNVIRIGVADNNNVILEGKLSNFSEIAKNDYERTQFLLKTKYDYVVFFRDYEGNVLNISGLMFIGKNNTNSTNIEVLESPAHLLKISRFVVLKEGETNTTAKIIEMVIYVWTKER